MEPIIDASAQQTLKKEKRKLSQEEFGAMLSIESAARGAFLLVQERMQQQTAGTALLENTTDSSLIQLRLTLIDPELSPEDRLTQMCGALGIANFQQLSLERPFEVEVNRATAACITSRFTDTLVEHGYLSRKEITARNAAISAKKVEKMVQARKRITMSRNNEGLILHVIDLLNDESNYVPAEGGRHNQARNYSLLCAKINEFMAESVATFHPFPEDTFRSRLNQFIDTLDPEYQQLIQYNQFEKRWARTVSDHLEEKLDLYLGQEAWVSTVMTVLASPEHDRYGKYKLIAESMGINQIRPAGSKATEKAIATLCRLLVEKGVVIDRSALHSYLDLHRKEKARAARRNGARRNEP